MVTAEGVFPKVGGDPIYYSEANRFREKVIGWNAHPNQFTSGTAYQIAGSYLYTGVYPSIICDHLDTSVSAIGDSSNINTNINLRLSYSGTLFNFATNVRNTNFATNVGKPFVAIRDIFTSGAINASGGNVGSPFFIFAEVQYSNNTTNVDIFDFACVGV